jgi:hypothetical protein
MNKLTVSDWITFLSAEKHGTVSSILGIGGIFIALIALIYSLRNNNIWDAVVSGVFVIALAIYMWRESLVPLQKRGIPAQKILEQIMRGQLVDADSIQKEWERLVPPRK